MDECLVVSVTFRDAALENLKCLVKDGNSDRRCVLCFFGVIVVKNWIGLVLFSEHVELRREGIKRQVEFMEILGIVVPSVLDEYLAPGSNPGHAHRE